MPSSPLDARRPTSGSITCTPRSRRICRLACVAACSYIALFIAGATTSGQVAASAEVQSRLSAKALRELRQRVRRGRRDQIQIGVGDQLQVAQWLVRWRRLAGERPARRIALELVAEHRRSGERREGRLTDEAQ